ncbi:lantibiotic dehydratase [Spirosoma flavum]|uniref:Lantibiotic dehydratase n=1 Tax=Spirosoma flavum TaxID=2048557 RepID=A0ABW6AT35_9BACT
MKSQFDHHSFFVVRLPYKPISELVSQINAYKKDSPGSYTALLQSLLKQHWFEEALFLASPSLHATWQTEKSKTGELESALANALWRYVFRSYGRATPYGLFAGMGVGSIGSKRQIEFDNHSWQTVSRPDSATLAAVSHTLAQDKAIRPYLHYRLNNSLYEVTDQFRFSERSGTLLKSKIVLSSIDSTPDLRKLVELLREKGQLSYETLINLYGPDLQEEVAEYINALIDDQFLLSNLSIPITGLDMCTYLLDQLNSLPVKLPVTTVLQAAQTDLGQSPIDKEKLFQAQNLLQQVLSQVDLPVNQADSLVQTDLFLRPTRLQLDKPTIFQIVNQFDQVLPLLLFKDDSPLQDFCTRFKERFDKQEVDLLTVLDPEVGIGFTNDTLSSYPILADLPFVAKSVTDMVTDPLEHLREILYSRFLLGGRQEVVITQNDIDLFLKDQPHLRVSTLPSWYVHGELFEPLASTNNPSHSTEPVTSTYPDGWRFVLNSTSGGSSAFFFGRFCHGDEYLRGAVETMCAWEQTQYSGDILAEIVHWPVSPRRAGNVVSRPVLRPYEIPYLTPEGVSSEQTISLSDLLVSVTDAGQVILRSKKTYQRVRPQLSSAHNPAHGDEVYQFLAYVQRAESQPFGWSWRSLSQLAFLPRLIYQNLVISPAQWIIRKESIPSNQIITAASLRELYSLPRYVQLVEGDNKLLLDLEFEPAQKVLVDEVAKQGKILLKEWLGEFYQPWLSHDNKQYNAELVIPLKTVASHQPPGREYTHSVEPSKPRKTSIQRSFPPGQDWLYFKVYLHEQVSDQFMATVLQPLIQQAIKKGWCTNVFFVRYADPENHLRIRFKTVPKKDGKLLELAHKAFLPYVESGLVNRIQLDTYQRELERYKPDLIEFSEAIFCADSQLFLNWLTQAKTQLEADRYALALLSIDALLNDFSYSLPDKARLSHQLQQAFFHEQAGTKELKRRLNDLYREYHHSFFAPSSTAMQLVKERSRNIQSAVLSSQRYFDLTHSGKGYGQFVASLLHMALNRIFAGQNRRHEMVAYHFLTRHYESLLSRAGKNV